MMVLEYHWGPPVVASTISRSLTQTEWTHHAYKSRKLLLRAGNIDTKILREHVTILVLNRAEINQFTK